MSSEESNVFSLSGELEESGSEKDLLYKLAAIGVNQAWRSYDEESKQLSSSFLDLDKCVIFCSTILYISVYPVIPFFAIMSFMIATLKYIFWKFRKL